MTDSLVIALKNADNQAMAREEADKFKADVESVQ